MEQQPPLISIIIATFNAAPTLERCLESIARQTYAHRELIVMDGASTVGTVDILKAKSTQMTYWESEPDRGIYHAWNKGLERATGDWICFVGADDFFWDEYALEHLAPHLAVTAPPARVVYGDVALISKQGDVVRHLSKPWDEVREEFARQMCIPHSGTMHHKGIFQDHGVFDDSFRIAADYDLLLRELLTRPALFVPEAATVGFQHGGLSNTPSAMATMLRELARIRKKHNLPDPLSARFSRMRIKMTLCAVTVRLIGEPGFRRLADGWRRITGRPAVWE